MKIDKLKTKINDETNKYGNIINKKIAQQIAYNLGLTVVKSKYGGYILE